MPDPFIYTCDDVMRMLDALLNGRAVSAVSGKTFAVSCAP
jgi:hypothetical protein